MNFFEIGSLLELLMKFFENWLTMGFSDPLFQYALLLTLNFQSITLFSGKISHWESNWPSVLTLPEKLTPLLLLVSQLCWELLPSNTW